MMQCWSFVELLKTPKPSEMIFHKSSFILLSYSPSLLIRIFTLSCSGRAQLLGSGGHQTSRHPSDLIGETLEECRENQSAINHLLLAKVAKDDTWAAWNVWLRSF